MWTCEMIGAKHKLPCFYYMYTDLSVYQSWVAKKTLTTFSEVQELSLDTELPPTISHWAWGNKVENAWLTFSWSWMTHKPECMELELFLKNLFQNYLNNVLIKGLSAYWDLLDKPVRQDKNWSNFSPINIQIIRSTDIDCNRFSFFCLCLRQVWVFQQAV